MKSCIYVDLNPESPANLNNSLLKVMLIFVIFIMVYEDKYVFPNILVGLVCFVTRSFL